MTDLLEVVHRLSDDELDEALTLAEDRYFPDARDTQQVPAGVWLVWLILAGRGFGKTRTGAEWLIDEALANPGSRWAIVAPTFGDARDTCVEGESGLLAVLRRRRITGEVWNRSLGELRLVNGARIKLFSADEPERLRGPQHHGAWCDEPASWRYGVQAWDQLQFGLRLGEHPRTVVTGTPKPVPLVKQLVGRGAPDVQVTRGSTFDNADNLAPSALAGLRARYEGTRLGRQELHAELLEDVEGALWTRTLYDTTRVDGAPDLAQVAVAVDPSGGDQDGNDEQGIVVVGRGIDGHGYTLADRSCRLSPDGWGSRAVQAFVDFDADEIVVEANFGGDMAISVVNAAAKAAGVGVRVRKVTASRGKRLRAEPVAALFEQGRAHHVGVLGDLEDQGCSWTADSGRSPDRLDAEVWGYTAVMLAAERRTLTFRGAA